jgi:alpha-tubulin suppressor-like RCC1 family protein
MKRSIPTLINLNNIIEVSAGNTHSLLLNKNGQVYAFGDGNVNIFFKK